MSDDELKDKILAYVIDRHTEIKRIGESSKLPTYDEIRVNFREVGKERFEKHFNIVRESFLDEKKVKREESQEKLVNVFWENDKAKTFLYEQGGYTRQEKQRKIAEQVARAAISSSKSSKSSSKAAWGSALAAIILLFTTFWNTAKGYEKITPFILRTQELMQAREKQILELQNEVMLLRAKVEALESVAHDSSIVSSKAKTHK